MTDTLVFALDLFSDGAQQRTQISLVEPQVFGAGSRAFTVAGDEAELARMQRARVGQGVLTGAGNDPPGDDVAVAGEFLFRRLAEFPALSRELGSMLNPPAERAVLVSFAHPGTENLPFEALYAPAADFPTLSDTARFLNLDTRWPIGRTARGHTIPQSPKAFEPPLRLVAVLAALNVDPTAEWEALRAALTAPGAIDTDTLVLVADEALARQIDGQAVPGVTVDLVPARMDQLHSQIQAHRPHILHFFCHGSSVGGGQLQVASTNDVRGNATMASLVLDAADVQRCAAPGEPPIWLAVLNCCRSAGADPRLTSLGLQLLQSASFGAVIAMREPVLDTDAALLTGAFYPAVLSELHDRVSQVRSGPLSWPALLVPARQAVARRPGVSLTDAAKADKAWTLPVVFVQPTGFDLPIKAAPDPAGPPPAPGAPHPGAPGQAHPAGPEDDGDDDADRVVGPQPDDPRRAEQLELDLFRGVLSRLTADAPPALRADIEQRIATLEGLLR